MAEQSKGVRATARFIQMSPQKVRLVVDMVRGRDVIEALDMLRFTPKAAAKPVAKVVRSAVANAEENMAFSRDELYIAEIFADQGPTRRWRRFGGRGRFKPIKKRSSHITVVLREREPAEG
jgi:large subunit ribosomal protein L22